MGTLCYVAFVMGRLWRGDNPDRSRRKGNIVATGLPFLPPNVLADGVQVAVEPVCVLLPNPPNFVDNWVVSHG